MSFVKLSIFGTSFEVSDFGLNDKSHLLTRWIFKRWPLGMSTCNLSEWVRVLYPIFRDSCVGCSWGGNRCFRACLVCRITRALHHSLLTLFVPFLASGQFIQGSAYRAIRRHQENHEAIQHASTEQTYLSWIEITETYSAWKCESMA